MFETTTMPGIELTEEQERAVDLSTRFLQSGKPGEFRLGGYAGTGKTTIVKTVKQRAAASGMTLAIAALSGKAVDVLRRKGLREAMTIHSTIYDYDSKTREFFRRPAIGADAFIIDEASMVGEDLYADLKAFRKPILFVGDMGQLEPVGSDINLMNEPDLDIKLETIHRQAEGNPVIELATWVRQGKAIERDFTFGTVTVGSVTKFMQSIHWADQILCGTSARRHRVNARIRADRGLTAKLHEGEKLICIQNDKDFKVFNGMGLTVTRILGDEKETIRCDLTTDDGEPLKNVPIFREQLGKERDKHARYHRGSILCDYGYCVTVHKAQGSEWNKVLVIEDCQAWDMNRWRYTAVTRAAEELVYCF